MGFLIIFLIIFFCFSGLSPGTSFSSIISFSSGSFPFGFFITFLQTFFGLPGSSGSSTSSIISSSSGPFPLGFLIIFLITLLGFPSLSPGSSGSSLSSTISSSSGFIPFGLLTTFLTTFLVLLVTLGNSISSITSSS